MTRVTIRNSIQPKKPKRRDDESKLQQACVSWFRMQYVRYSLRLFAIPNGGFRDKKTITKKDGSKVTYSPTAKRLKDEGVVRGVFDLFLAIPRGNYHGMFIEMKVHDNDLSEHQETFLREMKGDYYCCACWTFEEFVSEVRNYLASC